MNNLSAVEAIFFIALEKNSPGERAAYLDEACQADAELRRCVERLLNAQPHVGRFLQAAPGPTADDEHSHVERLGTRIGPYKLLQQIGEGGMGVVYMAEQETPVRRKVALKIIKPGMDSSSVIARFEAERQALALMDHPNIAKVFDAGTTDAGRPYFVMELVHGVPLTQFCDDNRLTPSERLHLFVPVCQAIQHAHQKGIIHRDIKPSNVLVTMHDDKPVPKVIDFGVAKAIEQRLTEKTLFTQFGALVGTFEYMSPEQAEMNAFGVDTRSDIYALGVLLYELLTGTTPLERQRLRQAALDELVRLIREEEPPRPSVRLSSSDTLANIAAARKTEPARLSKLLRGEIDWIVMKCLEKDRTRRYEAASSLAKDIERYLADEPVEACPPSAGYRLRKFARKYRKPLAVAGMFALLLLAGAAVSAWQAIRAREAESVAVEQRDAARESEKETNKARQDIQKERDKVVEARRDLVRALEDFRRSLYLSEMRVAQNAWRQGDTRRVLQILERYQAWPGVSDFRGFEWHYLWRLSHSAQLTLPYPASWVGFSPDGLRIASVNNGNTLKVWNALSGREVFTFHSPTSTYPEKAGGAFSSDGKLVALTLLTGPDIKGEVKVLDAATGKEVAAFKGHKRPVHSIAFSPDGKRMVSAGGDPQIKIWEATSGKELLALTGFNWGHSCVAFSHDGKRIAAGANSGGTVKIWDAATGREVLNPKHLASISTLTFSPDGKLLAAANSLGEAAILQADTGTKVLSFRAHMGWIYSLAFSPDSKQLATASGFGEDSVKIWDAASGEQLRTIRGHNGSVWSVAFRPDGRRLAAASGGAVKIWDVTTDQEFRTVKGGSGPIWRMVFSPDGRLLASTDWGAAPRLWDTKAWVASGPAPTLWDPKTWIAAPVLKGPKGEHYVGNDSGEVIDTVFSADGQRLAAAIRMHDAKSKEYVVPLRVWDVQTGRQLCILTGQSHWVSSMAFSSDGHRLASVSHKRNDEAAIKVWDVSTGREILDRRLPARDVGALAFSPDGQLLASAVWIYHQERKQGRHEVKLWNVSTGEEVLTLKGHTDDIIRIVFSADGRFLASASADGTVRTWDAVAGREIVVLRSHPSSHSLECLAFSPDGRRLATASGIPNLPDQPGEVRIWDLVTGRETLILDGHKARISSLAFSPDGRRLVSSDYKGVIRIWEASPPPEK
ncbi:MAG TPA: serine/threonine-protein kinase [Gemmataceae bacterium]|jgi:WD40 repeat protein/serine/threonine protein kinase